MTLTPLPEYEVSLIGPVIDAFYRRGNFHSHSVRINELFILPGWMGLADVMDRFLDSDHDTYS